MPTHLARLDREAYTHIIGYRHVPKLRLSDFLAVVTSARPCANSAGARVVDWLAVSAHGAIVALLRGQQLCLESNIVVGKFAHLCIVDTENLRIFRSAKACPGGEVHGPADDGRHDKAPRETRHAIGSLDAQLTIIVIQPAAIDNREPVIGRDGLFRKEASQEVAHDTADGVAGEDIETVVDADHEFELGRKVTNGAGNDAKNDRAGSKGVWPLPGQFRRLRRPSSPVSPKASFTNLYFT
jgi:hypothetical protein